MMCVSKYKTSLVSWQGNVCMFCLYFDDVVDAQIYGSPHVIQLLAFCRRFWYIFVDFLFRCKTALRFKTWPCNVDQVVACFCGPRIFTYSIHKHVSICVNTYIFTKYQCMHKIRLRPTDQKHTHAHMRLLGVKYVGCRGWSLKKIFATDTRKRPFHQLMGPGISESSSFKCSEVIIPPGFAHGLVHWWYHNCSFLCQNQFVIPIIWAKWRHLSKSTGLR